MRASSGEHYIALDHVRALAAFLVFSWHFTHGIAGWPVPFSYSPALFLFAPLDEGHTGVALFMTLSGYLFAKLLSGRMIEYPAFFWNRFVRLVPLLVFVFLLSGLRVVYEHGDLTQFARDVASGWILPSLPNGGWSITIEFHFYLLLPLLLGLGRKSKLLLAGVIGSAILLRLMLYHIGAQVQWYAYWTIIGRIDQFVFGMLAFYLRSLLQQRHFAAVGTALGFCFFYWLFDLLGGLHASPALRSTSAMWILMPTLEGLCFATLIAYYDSSFSPANRGISWFIGRIGAFSYSIYLFHFFVVFEAARFVNAYFFALKSFYIAIMAALVCFLFMLPVGYLSFRYIEAPFLRLRRRYVIGVKSGAKRTSVDAAMPW